MSNHHVIGHCAIPAPLPHNEEERLQALRRMRLLDTGSTEALDRITRMASRVLGVPIVLVSLVDESRQWFKSRIGLDAIETPRDASFCAYAIHDADPFHVGDASLDPRFAGNPLVTGAPYVRSYLGVPIRSQDHHAVGTLCMIDTLPRTFTADEIDQAKSFAAMAEDVVRALEREQEVTSALRRSDGQATLFRDTFDAAPVGIVHTSLDGQPMRVNRHVCELLGYSERELLSVSFVDITHPDDVPDNTCLFLQLVSGAIDEYRMEKRFLRADGEYLWTDLSVRSHRGATGRPDFMISVIEDASHRKRMEADFVASRAKFESDTANQTAKLVERNNAMLLHVKKLLQVGAAQRATEQRLRVLTDSMPAMIGYWNEDLVCEFANAAYFQWFGRHPAEIVGKTMRDLMGDALFGRNEPYARAALAGMPQTFERQLARPDGSISYTDARYIPDEDEVGRVRGFFVLVTDITPLRAAKKDLERANALLAMENTTDYLTGVANRRVFQVRSDDAARQFREQHRPYGLMLIDLDDFKRVNDRFGHDSGDEVLRSVGRILRDQLRDAHDVAARMGGEEFAVLCEGPDVVRAMHALAERIRQKICREVVTSAQGDIGFTASFGVAFAEAEDASWKDIYARADRCLYEAKRAGKDRIVMLDPDHPRSLGNT